MRVSDEMLRLITEPPMPNPPPGPPDPPRHASPMDLALDLRDARDEIKRLRALLERAREALREIQDMAEDVERSVRAAELHDTPARLLGTQPVLVRVRPVLAEIEKALGPGSASGAREGQRDASGPNNDSDARVLEAVRVAVESRFPLWARPYRGLNPTLVAAYLRITLDEASRRLAQKERGDGN